MKNRRILLLSSQYLPHIGGVEQYVDHFAKELAKQGHFVTIITSQIEGAEEKELFEIGQGFLEIIRFPSIPLMNGRFPFLKINKRLKYWEQELFRRQQGDEAYDLMLVNMRFYMISLYGVRLAKRMKLPVMILDHGTSHLNTGGRISSKMGEWFEHGITALEKHYCHHFAGVSQATLDWISHFKIQSNLVLYNAIDPEEFAGYRAKKVRDFRTEYSIPQDALLLSFVGRLTIEKGIEELVRAVSMANKELQKGKIYLLAAGEGYLREKLEPLLPPDGSIHFTGMLDKEEVTALLMDSDVFVLPSVSEGFPTTVLEASVCDNFVISTYRGGTKELIKNREYGIILENNDPTLLKDALLEVFDQQEYRIQAAMRTRKAVEENYTWEATVACFLKAIDQMSS